ncbi:MAG: sulfatase-like hydrolase/transferase, partial [Pirellulaceae bacterium]|nr:sulfatase-like hydrolase/transferase [Pirellulaceae bacterium]
SIFRDNQRSAEDRGQYITDVFRREALKFIDQPIDKPWLLYLCFNAPHSASSFGDAAPGEKTKVGVQAPPTQIERQVSRGVSRSLAAYYAAVEQMDAAIGQIVQRLETNGQLNNTLILFMSDNGGSGNGGNAPLRGQKSTMWEGGLRVPMIAHWPGQIPPAKVTDEFLCAMDLLPTILKVTQTARPTDVQLDGFDVWPVLSGTGNSPRHSLFWQRRADRAARVENWKWVQSAKGSGLFDLSTDQSEKHDLSAQRPEVLTMMKQKFDQWLSEMEQSEPRGPFRDY